MDIIESKGKTVDEAILNGLKQMNLAFDEVNVEVISEGKGFLGFGKSVLVRLTKKEEEIEVGNSNSLEAFLKNLFDKMGVDVNASIVESDDQINITLEGDSTGILIGRRGETLDSIQYLTSLFVNKNSENYKRVNIDTENYRKKREQTLINLAKRLAAKVERTGRKVSLEPMNPYERRILHAALHDHPTVMTISEGQDPYRRVIIKKKTEN